MKPLYTGMGFDCMVNLYALRIKTLGCGFGFTEGTHTDTGKCISDTPQMVNALSLVVGANLGCALSSSDSVALMWDRSIESDLPFSCNIDLYSLLSRSLSNELNVTAITANHIAPRATSAVRLEEVAAKGISKPTSSEIAHSSSIAAFWNKGISEILPFASKASRLKRRDAVLSSEGLLFGCSTALMPMKGATSELNSYSATGASVYSQVGENIGFANGYNFAVTVGIEDSTEVVLGTPDGKRYIRNPATGKCFLDDGAMARAHPTWRPCLGKGTWKQDVTFYIRGSYELETSVDIMDEAFKMPVHADDSSQVSDIHQFQYFDGLHDTYPTPRDTAFEFYEYGAISTSRKVLDGFGFDNSTHIVAVKPLKVIDGFMLHAEEVLPLINFGVDDEITFDHVFESFVKWTGHYEYDHEFTSTLEFSHRVYRMKSVDLYSVLSTANDIERLLIQGIEESIDQLHSLMFGSEVGQNEALQFGNDLAKLLNGSLRSDSFSLTDEAATKLARVYRMQSRIKSDSELSMEARTGAVTELQCSYAMAVSGAYELRQEQFLFDRFFSNFWYLTKGMELGDVVEQNPRPTSNNSPVGLLEDMDRLRIIAPAYHDKADLGDVQTKFVAAGEVDSLSVKNTFSYEYVSYAGVDDGFGFSSNLGFGRYTSVEDDLGFGDGVKHIRINHIYFDDALSIDSSVEMSVEAIEPEESRSRMFNTFMFNSTTYN